MELKTFTEMFSDKYAFHYKKLKYKYGEENLIDYLNTLKGGFFERIPLLDFQENNIFLLPSKVNLTTQVGKTLTSFHMSEKYSLQAMEEEIISTLSIEQIDSSRESIKRILQGAAPLNSNENKAYGIKRGLDFISDTTNKITEDNLFKLYQLAIGDFLEDDDRLMPNKKYRHDAVYVVGETIEHQGLLHQLLPGYVSMLIEFTNMVDTLDQIVKSSIIHYYFAYLHPYFDGNGRMARLLQLWYLVQKGYTASLFIPLSSYINKSKGLYYKAFTTMADNFNVSGTLDVTPFVNYFVDQVLAKIPPETTSSNAIVKFNELLKTGEVTAKEKDLFHYILSAYGTREFSTKELEKDYKNAAYATIRSFVLKLECKNLLASQKYGNRVKYRVKQEEL